MKGIISFITLILLVQIPLNARIINIPRDEQTIQDGIYSARESDTVLVAPGIYYENIDLMGKHITLASHFILNNDKQFINSTIIDGSRPKDKYKASVIFMWQGEDERTVLSGFTIRGGTGTYVWIKSYNYFLGGGVLIIKCGATIVNNHIVQNKTDDYAVNCCTGSGICVWGTGKVIIKNNLIEENYSAGQWADGAVCMWTYDQILFENNIVQNNKMHSTRESWGAGVSLYGEISILGVLQGNISVRGNIIRNNHNTSNNLALGGGLWIKNISPVLENNLIFENSATLGGGVYIQHRPSCSGVSKPYFINNSIIANSANYGGGVYMAYDINRSMDFAVKFSNTIISGNNARIEGNEVCLNNLLIKPDFYYCNIAGGMDAFGGPGSGSNFDGAFENCTTGPLEISTLINCSEHADLEGKCQYFHLATLDTVCVDKGNPDQEFNDCIDITCGVKPQWPSLGELRNDIGAYGGKYALKLDAAGMSTSIKMSSANIPFNYTLEQNYPNPFNPETKIRFSLPKSDYVKLEVFNMMGQRIAELISREMQAGEHEVVFRPELLASGFYYYRLNTRNFQQVRKMIFLK